MATIKSYEDRMNIVNFNVIKMLEARKFTNIKECEITDEYKNIFGKLLSSNDKEGDNVYIMFLYRNRLNISAVRAIVNYLGINTENNISKKKCHGIVIHHETPTSSGSHQLGTLGSTGCSTIECFKESFFYNCIIEHDLVPLHVKVTKHEADTLKKKFGQGKMMSLLSGFPISRYYEFKPGDVIKIIRKSGITVYREVKKS